MTENMVPEDVPGAHALRELGELLRAEGAWFNKIMQLRLGYGGVGVFAAAPFTQPQSILRVPLSAMPVISDFDLDIADDQFVVRGAAEAATPLQCEVFALMIEYYNASRSLETWRKASPWFALQSEPAALKHLCWGRDVIPKVKRFSDYHAIPNTSQLLKETFLGSRAFNLKQAHQRAAGRRLPADNDKVLFPIIDFFNHDMFAQGFQINDSPEPANMRVFGRPDTETREIFVRYNQYDPVDTYLYYGFVDERAPYLSSVAFDLECQGRRLQIFATGGMLKGPLPATVKDLRVLMPVISKTEDGVSLSKLIIPGVHAPRALRRVLALVLRHLDMADDTIRAEVVRIEAEVIERNREYWKQMQHFAAPLAEHHALNALCRTALSRIDQYSSTVMGKDL